jgi:hypothetical protein
MFVFPKIWSKISSGNLLNLSSSSTFKKQKKEDISSFINYLSKKLLRIARSELVFLYDMISEQ